MHTRPRIAVLLLFGMLLLVACGPSAGAVAVPSLTPAPTVAVPSPTPAPTVVPSPTPAPAFAVGSHVAGVDVGGLGLAAARERLVAALSGAPRPLELRAGAVSLTLDPKAVGLSAPVDDLLGRAEPALRAGKPADVPFSASLDEAALRAQLTSLAERAAAAPVISVISSTKTISRSFAYTPGTILDVDAALPLVRAALASARPAATLALTLSVDPTVPQVSAERLLAEVQSMAAQWDGVVGFHLYDLKTGAETRFHDKTVFAGASTIKVAIMLNAYIKLAKFSEKQEFWLGEMIKYSDNISANHLLAAAAGGTGTELAFSGAVQMSKMLADDLGQANFYLYIPYEATDFIRQNKIKYKCGPKDPVGEKPYTETGCALRATPYAIAQVYKAIDACAEGGGVLLEKFDTLTPKRCQEMLNRLATNHDLTRLVAGLPKGTRAEHKSGWIEDMQADAGRIETPGGNYVISVYVYKKLTGGVAMWPDDQMAPVVAAFSRLAYTAYNPIRLKKP
jgi:beta-lactamase class A